MTDDEFNKLAKSVEINQTKKFINLEESVSDTWNKI